MKTGGYKFYERPDSIDLLLTKEHEGNTVDIVFKSALLRENSDDYEYEEVEDLEENNDEEVMIAVGFVSNKAL